MTRPIRLLKRVGGDTRAATIIEFAMILPALCVVLLGLFELGYQAYVSSVLQGALHDAARRATVGGVTGAQLETLVKGRLASFTDDVTIQTKSYHEYSHVAQPEPMTTDNPPLNVVNVGDCWRDYIPDGQRNEDRGRGGLGNADDVVLYEVTARYDRLFPIYGFLGWSASQELSGSTLLSNQPFAGRILTVPIACKS